TNKLWNALLMLKGVEVVNEEPNEANRFAMLWIEQKLNENLVKINENFEQYRLSEILTDLYNFIWDDFCSWYLEMVKPAYGAPIDKATLDFTIEIFEKLMIIL